MKGEPCQVSEWWKDTSPRITGHGRASTSRISASAGGVKPCKSLKFSNSDRSPCVRKNAIWLPHLWLPGTIHMQPFSSVASSKGIHAETGVIGLMIGHKGASWCQWVEPP